MRKNSRRCTNQRLTGRSDKPGKPRYAIGGQTGSTNRLSPAFRPSPRDSLPVAVLVFIALATQTTIRSLCRHVRGSLLINWLVDQLMRSSTFAFFRS